MKHLIVGLGITGWSCVSYFKQQGQAVVVADTRATPPYLSNLQTHYPDVPYHLGPLSADLLNGIDEVVVSPGLAHTGPFFEAAAARGIPVIGDIAVFIRAATAPIIGITGTNGKSTVTALVGQLLQDAGYTVGVGGNLGIPALSLLQPPEKDVYVLELSSYQLDTIPVLPLQSATILNVTPDHLDRYGTLEAYAHSKQRIYNETQCAVVNRADERTAVLQRDCAVIGFGLEAPVQAADYGIVWHEQARWFAKGSQRLCLVSDSILVGEHNVANVLAALALVDAYQLPVSSIQKTLRTFKGLAHRCQVVANEAGVLWINDSKGTNVCASQVAMRSLQARGPLVLLFGGKPKQEDYGLLIPLVREVARCVIVMGDIAPVLSALFEPYQDSLPVYRAHSMSEAVQLAAQMAQPGDVVLFSPACPSYDWYQNYEERGQDFVHCVNQQHHKS